MPLPLLETKLYVPRSRRALVPRPRLRARLDQGASATLMLVSAPAGFGKTTVLSQWLTDWLGAGPAGAGSRNERVAAWLSLDKGDNDPASFWTYVIAALRTATPGVGAGTLALLQETRLRPIPSVLTALLNDLDSVASDIVLVLDDYHVIDAPDVQRGMAFLLDHTPPHVHLVIASRADPALPLSRLRARGELVETRAADLRFTSDETAAYLNQVVGLSLTASDVAVLEGRTEGWVAALQLAALSMQGRDDIAGFLAGFAGDDRYVVDYLVEEVLQRQPERVQTFLLQTSILSRLSGPLCDAVTGESGGRAMLEALDRGNLFLVSLDDRRRWYRYHQLFADVLQARLLDEKPEQVRGLHGRASGWYQQQGEQSAAIRHALAAEDYERAADLVEMAMPATRRDRQEATLRGWLELLPDDLMQVRPVLSNGFAGALLSTGEVEGVELYLRRAERWLESDRPEESANPQARMVVVDQEEFRRLPGGVAVHRAGQALARGDSRAAVSFAQRALDLLQDDDHLGQGAAAALIGLASWGNGDLEKAHEAYTSCTASMNRAGHLSDVLGCSIILADLRIAQGRLREAMRTYERALELTPERSGTVLRGTADMYVGMSALHRERNDLQVARQLLVRSEQLGEHTGLPRNRYRWRVAMARIKEAEGDLSGAVSLLDEAERVYVGDFAPDVRPVPSLRARVWVAQGNLDDTLAWARDEDLSVENDLSYLREFEHLTLARALLARSPRERSLDEVIGFLARLLHSAEEGRRTGSILEILVLQALAHRLRDDIPAALLRLERALTLAGPEGYVRLFVDEGPAMGELLEVAVRQGIAKSYVSRLIVALDGSPENTPAVQHLIEPLSERELDVLRLLRTDLDGPDIARRLTVSLNTMRTHTKNIYAKLGVNNRRAAVRRAEELGLMSGNHRQPLAY